MRFLQTEVLTLEPYLAVGIIACTRRVLTASVELSHLPAMTDTQFYQYLMDVGLKCHRHHGARLRGIHDVFMIRKHPPEKSSAMMSAL